MRVHLVPPPGWVSDALVQDRVLSPDRRVALDASQLTDLPEDQATWILATLQASVPAGRVLRVVHRELAETEVGWSVALVDAIVEHDGRECGARLAAFYAFLQLAGHAIALADSAAVLHAHDAALRTTLLGAVPDLGGPLVAIADFWR